MLYTGCHASMARRPCAIRAAQGPGTAIEPEMTALPVGKAEVRREGRSGLAAARVRHHGGAALRAVADRLDATVVNMRFVKPLDEELVCRARRSHDLHRDRRGERVAGGAGSAVSECLAAHGIERHVLHIGIPDQFIEHGSREDCLVDGRARRGRPRAGRCPSLAGAAGRAARSPAAGPAQPDHGSARDATREADGRRAGPRRFAAASRSTRSASRTSTIRCGSGTARRRAAHRRELQHVRGAAAQLQGHAHVALRGGAAPARARDLGRVVPADAGRDDAAARCDLGPHRDELPVLRHEDGPGLRRGEPDGLRGHPDRRDPRRPRGDVDPRRGAGDEPVPVLEADLRLRRPQPALAHHDQGAGARPPLARGTDRHRRAGSLVRAVRDPEAPGREVRDRARLRQPEVRRGHRPRRRRAAECRGPGAGLRGGGGELRVHPQPLGLRADREGQGRRTAV